MGHHKRSRFIRQPIVIITALALGVGALTGIAARFGPADAALIPPGSFDPTFGTAGPGHSAVDSVAGANNENVQATVVDFQRRTLVAVSDEASPDSFLVHRYTTEGKLDRTFGDDDGSARVDLSTFGGQKNTNAMTLDNFGKILVAGFIDNGANTNIIIAALNEDGSVDGSYFGSTGILVKTFGGDNSIVYSLAVDGLNRLIVAGVSITGGGPQKARMIRMLSDGTTDPAFATTGLATPDEGAGGFLAGEVTQYRDVVVRPAGPGTPETYIATGYTSRPGGATLVHAFDDVQGRVATWATGSPLGQFNHTSASANPLFANAIDRTADGGVAVALRGSAYADGGGVLRLDENGNPVGTFGTTGFSNLFEVDDLVVYGDGIFITGFGGAALGLIGLLDDADGSLNTAFGTNASPRVTTFPLLGAHFYEPRIAVDGAGVPVVGFGDGSVSQVRRFVGLAPPGPRSATKLFFSEAGKLFAMTSIGEDVVSMSAPNSPLGETDISPSAGFSGDMFFQRNNPGSTRIWRADASDGANAADIGANFHPGVNLTHPSYADDGTDAFVGYIRPGGCMTRTHAGLSFFNDGGCGYSEAWLNPVDPQFYVGVRSGEVAIGGFGFSSNPMHVTNTGGLVEHAKWGTDGTTIVFTRNDGTSTALAHIDAPAYVDTPTNIQTSTDITSVFASITSLAVSPDFGDPSVVFVQDDNQMRKVEFDGSGLHTLRAGTNLQIGDWVRNFATFQFGPSPKIEPQSIATADVPIQSGSPDAQAKDPTIQNAGLLNLKLLKFPLLNLKLFKSPLLNLKLLKFGLLNLKLLKFPINDAMGLNSDLREAPKVRAGLQKISLATLPILDTVDPYDGADRGGWRDRMIAHNTPAALALSRLTLQEVSLYDVLILPGFAFPSLDQMNLENSVFGSLSSMPFMLGDTRLSAIDLSPITPAVTWCDVFEALDPSDDCGATYGAPGDTRKGASASLLGLQIAGVNLDSLPGVDLGLIKYGQVTPAVDAPLPGVLLDSVVPNLNATSVGGTKLSALSAASLAAVVECTPPFNCGDPNATLGSADAANQIKDEALLSDLGDAVDDLPLHELTLGLIGTPADDPYDKPADQLGINPTSAGSAGASFAVLYARLGTGPGSTVNPTYTVKLPDGYVYKPGSSQVNFAGIPDPIVAGQILTWDTNVTIAQGDSTQLNFRAFAVNPPEFFDENDFEATQLQATISTGAFAQSVGSDPILASDGSETGDTIASGLNILPDRLYFGRLEPRGEGDHDVDYFLLPNVAPNSKITVYLNQLQYDADMVVLHPLDTNGPGDALRDPPTAQQQALTPIGDTPVKIYNGGEPLISDGEPDVLVPAGYPVAALSNNRGTRAERSEVITWSRSADGEQVYSDYIVQVAGFNGASGNKSYAIRYTVDPPRTVPVVPRTAYSHPGAAPAAPGLPAAPIETLVLTNPSRLADLYGSDPALPNVANNLTTLVNAPTAPKGVVFPVNSSAAVRNAYAAADANPGDPDLHNRVVRAINDAVDAFLGSRRGEVKNMIVVGTDEIIPFARLQDLSQIANERTFAQDLIKSTPGNALLGSALAGRILSDDPYAAFTPQPFGGTYLYAPDVAIGRLVESPAQINATITQYLNPEITTDPAGTLRPNKTLSAGYDFMKKVSQGIAQAFDDQISGAHDVLVNDSWDKNDVLGLLNGDAADLISLNAHYSPTALSPADRDAGDLSATTLTGTSTDPRNLARRLFFTMGCHSGYSITNMLAGAENPSDFAEMLSGEPVSAFIGNTGFGLGLQDGHAFSQKLFGDFGKLLASGSLGAALQKAKQQYIAGGVTNPYDYKVIAQTVFYGIPQYTIAGATPYIPPTEPPVVPAQIDPDTGLMTASVTFDQPTDGAGSQWELDETDSGDVWMHGDDTAVVPHRPIQAKLHREATIAGQVLAGTLVTGLTVGDEDTNFNPVLARPLLAGGINEPEAQFGDVVFPTTFADFSTYLENGLTKYRINVVPARFVSTGFDSVGNLIGTETRFSKVLVDALYTSASQTDLTDALLTDVEARQTEGSPGTQFRAIAQDPESGIKRVFVLYRSEGEEEFHPLDLTLTDPSIGLYTSTVAVTGEIEFLTQAVNGASHVTTKSKKGLFFNRTVVEFDPAVDVVFDPEPADASNTFYGPVTAFLNTEAPMDIHYTIDSGNGPGPEVLYTNAGIQFTAIGSYTVAYRTAEGDEGSFSLTISPPVTENVTVTLSRPPDYAPDWYTAPVTAHVQSDVAGAPPIEIKIDGGTFTTYPNNDVPFTSDGDHTLVYKTAAGTTNAANPFHVKVDKTPPVVEIFNPADDAQFVLNANESMDRDCTDIFLLSCVSNPAQDDALNTATVTNGVTPRTATATGTDEAGHSTTVTHEYSVRYAAANVCGHKVSGGGSAGLLTQLNITFKVCDANGNPVTDHNPAVGAPIGYQDNGSLGSTPAQGACAPLLGLLPICLLSPRQTSFVKSGTGWKFVHDTFGMLPGTYKFRVRLKDGTHMDYTVKKVLIVTVN